jgi:hypothetical protein
LAELITGLTAERVRANLAEVRERITAAAARAGRDPGEVEIVAAVKYVPADQLGALAEGGVTVVGENRAQDLQAKVAAHGDAFAWDFIGHVQSRKVKQIVPLVRLIHSVSTESVLEQLRRHATPDLRVSRARRRAHDDAAAGALARGQPALVRGAARARRRARPVPAVDGDDAGLRGRRRGGRDARAYRHATV